MAKAKVGLVKTGYNPGPPRRPAKDVVAAQSTLHHPVMVPVRSIGVKVKVKWKMRFGNGYKESQFKDQN